MKRSKLIVGVSGASGAPIAIEFLLALQEQRMVETHLVLTKNAQKTILLETDYTLTQVCELADVVHDKDAISDGPASGSFDTMGMVVVPCSMKTLAGIASGYSDNLLLRAADVTLKERRPLILVTRECPFGTIHLRNMLELSGMGATILPPVLSYYNHPETIQDCARHIVGKIMDSLSLEYARYIRWNG